MHISLGNTLVFILFLLGVLGILFVYKRKSRSSASANIIPFKPAAGKRSSQSGQACSFCRKKSGKLTFYAAAEGKVVGVCNHCKPQAERQALPRM